MMLNVAMCSSEAVPFAKTGGLADVAGTLPVPLKKLGINAIVVMPGYNSIFSKFSSIEKVRDNLEIELNKEYKEFFDILSTNYNGVDYYFIKNEKFFNRENLYGTPQCDYADNGLRFGFFSKAVLKLFEIINFKADIIHLHDYHFALTALLLKDLKENNPESILKDTHIIFTIHNIAYQGIYDKGILKILGIDYKYFNIDSLEYYGKVNYMKGGIIYSDKITTVSPTYAKEILTPEYGYGLDGILQTRSSDVEGIINGIDYNIWNPDADISITANYDINDLSGKQKCKENLIKELFKNSPAGKETFSKPLLGMVSRLSEQKGIDLIVTAMDKIMQEQDLFIVILGTGDEKYQNLLLDLCKRYERKLSIIIGFSEKLSREIYAGSDIFLMPSKYEPCGLGQLISLKYGTIPLVRNTGGLADTIIDIQDKKDIVKGGQGFKFNDYDWNQFYLAILRAVNFYRDKNSWEKIILNGMNSDFSWDYSAIKYKELYESLV